MRNCELSLRRETDPTTGVGKWLAPRVILRRRHSACETWVGELSGGEVAQQLVPLSFGHGVGYDSRPERERNHRAFDRFLHNGDRRRNQMEIVSTKVSSTEEQRVGSPYNYHRTCLRDKQLLCASHHIPSVASSSKERTEKRKPFRPAGNITNSDVTRIFPLGVAFGFVRIGKSTYNYCFAFRSTRRLTFVTTQYFMFPSTQGARQW